MCSVFDFIDKQNYFIQNQRKAIQTLYEFLESIDKPKDKKTESNGLKKQSSKQQSNGESKRNYVSNKKIENKNNFMNETNGLLGWISSDKSEKRRQKLAEERRLDYNEFLDQKSRLESRNSNKTSKRVTKLVPDYNDLLNSKRIEERKHRQTNGLDIDDIEDLKEVNSCEENRKSFPELELIGWSHHSNNKFVPEYITPRSRLLTTHSSRLKAARYSQELRKQVEEKERLRAEEKERIRLEDEELENKLEEQRIKLMREFEEERKLLKQKAKQESTEENKQLLHNDLMVGSTSPLSLLRSPTYMHMKKTKPIDVVSRKSSAFSRSLASVLSETIPNRHSMATQTSDEQKHITSNQFSDCDTTSNEDNTEDEEEEEEDISKDVEFRRRILSQLSEVRQMMESDHIKMMEQLREQQLSQLDE